MASLPTLENMSPTHLCVLTQVLTRDYKILSRENAKLRAKNKWYHDKFHKSLCDIKTEREINRRSSTALYARTREISHLRDTQRRLYVSLQEARATDERDRLREVALVAMNELLDTVGPAEFNEKLNKYGIITDGDGCVKVSLDRTAHDDEAVPVD